MAANELFQVLSCAPGLREKFDEPVAADDEDAATCVGNRAAGAFAGSPGVHEQPQSAMCSA